MGGLAAVPRCAISAQRGFTLIEIMVAIALMAVMTAVSWRGLDGLLRAQQHTQRNAAAQAVLQTAMAQWDTDLEQIAVVPVLRPLDWDGKVLRITRQSPRTSALDTAALRVVAWTDRRVQDQLYWARWQSHPITNRVQWVQAWQAAQLWAQGQSASAYGAEVSLLPMTGWQIFYAIEGRWVNPLSAPNSAPPPPGDDEDAIRYQAPGELPSLPDAIRLQLELAPGSALVGRVSRDWLNPSFGSSR